ncbi:MAG: ABC transporter ATP-binding protein [Planctomycetota bacterium]|jgi:putative ABC transport system ATP-binding protein
MSRRLSKVIVRTHGLRRDYHRGGTVTRALRGVDLEIHRGELLSIMGPSGSGKTTLFNAIGGLDTPTAGRVLIDETDIAQLNANELAYVRCKKIGYVFQSYNLVPTQTCLENVVTPMIFAGLIQDQARVRGMELLGLVGLADRWDHRPKELSGGQQQRTAIARGLANGPTILLCDEPTANLDLKTGQEINDLLVTLNKERGVTVICSTHDHRMLDVSDRVLWIRDGTIERVEERENLKIRVGRIDVGGES